MADLFAALLILRLGVGLTAAAHGAQKLFGTFGGPGMEGFGTMMERQGLRPGIWWALAAGCLEFFGGLFLAAGLLTPLAALAILAAMLSAIAIVHINNGFFNTKGGMEFPLVIACACVALATAGAGDYSADKLLGVSFPQPLTVVAGVIVVLAATIIIESIRISAVDHARVAPGD
jgi:putative oxidoreductase